jgi:hypothetical protein
MMMTIGADRGRAAAVTMTMTTIGAVAAGAGAGMAIPKGTLRPLDGVERTTTAAAPARVAATTMMTVVADRARGALPTIAAMVGGSVIPAAMPKPPAAAGKIGVEPAKQTARLTAGRHRRPSNGEMVLQQRRHAACRT